MNTKLNLEAVEADFFHWRQNRGKQKKIPQELWEKAISLIGSYKIGEIVKKLKLSGSQFAEKRKELTTNSTTFVQLETNSTPNIQFQNLCNITVQKVDGNLLTITYPSTSQMKEIISAFLR